MCKVFRCTSDASCNNHGTCNSVTGKCHCRFDYVGKDCSLNKGRKLLISFFWFIFIVNFFLVCGGNQTNIGGLCCNVTQVNDFGICKNECGSERPVENGRVCECAEGLYQLGNGHCCNSTSLDGACAQQIQKMKRVKEYCLVDDNDGICRDSAECFTMASPARGTCSNTSYKCCVVEAPKDINNQIVKEYLDSVVITF